MRMQLFSLLPALLIATASAGAHPGEIASVNTAFAANSLIIPMDTSYQDSGMFLAYGLVDDLLRGGVKIRWAIASPKNYGAADFTLSAGVDVRSGGALSAVNYRGGPFVVDSADYALALPVVQRWQAAHAALAVHRATATFIAPVARVMNIAPDLAVFSDGNEDIAFGYLNAAQIPQSFLAGVKRVGPPVTVGGTISTAPVVSAAPAGNGVVTGTTVEANGTVINVFVNGLYAGATTVTATPNWSLGPIAIPPGINVTANATAPGEGTSAMSGNRASGALPAGGTSAAPVVRSPVRHGDVRVAGTSTEADGTVVKLFKNGVLHASGPVASGRWSLPLSAPAAGGETYAATATAPAKTESQLSNFAIVVPVAPVTAGNLAAGSRRPAGTLALADGTPVRIYRNRGGTVTLLESPPVANLAWQAAANHALLAGDVLWAEADTFPWPASTDNAAAYACPGRYCCPECNGEAAIIGPTTASDNDGALFSPEGAPRFCQFMSMHYGAPGAAGVVAEVRKFLTHPTHAFMECQAVNAFENVAAGRYLTTNGLVAVGTAAPYFYFNADSPFSQADGTYANPGGSERAFSLAPGSAYHASNSVLLSSTANQADGLVDVFMTGYLDDNPAMGIVSYLGGHEYTTTLPLSANPNSQGVRYFLNSLYEAPCVSRATPTLSLVISGPATSSAGNATFTIEYASTGAGMLNNTLVSLPVPPGMGFVSATGGGTVSGGAVLWNLGNLPAGSVGTLQVTLSFSADGTYLLTAAGSHQAGASLLSTTSNTLSTIRDTQLPAAPVVTAPADGSSTTNPTPTVTGTAEPNSTVRVYVDGLLVGTVTADGAGNWSHALTPGQALLPGAHSVHATATDSAGNLSADSTTANFNVVHAAPAVTGPITAGASSLSGTSAAADGTTITIYSNGVPIGTTTVSGGAWTLGGVSGLAGGEAITATAGSGATLSTGSNSVVVTPAAPVLAGPVVTGAGVTVGGTSSAPDGSSVTVLVNGVPVACTPAAAVGGGTWSCGGLSLNPGDVITSTVTAGGQTSAPSAASTVTQSAPAVSGPIYITDNSLSGTSGAADGTTITVYRNGVAIGTTTVSGGLWTLSGVGGLGGGDAITATAGAGLTTSPASAAVAVNSVPGLLRSGALGTLTPSQAQLDAIFVRRPGDPGLGVANRIVPAYLPGAAWPQQSSDYSDGATPIVFYQLEGNTGNTLRVAKDDLNGKLVITY